MPGRKLSKAPSIAQIVEFDEDYSELKGTRPSPGRKLSKAPSIAQIVEFDEDYSELKGARPLPGRKLSKQPSVAQIVEYDEDFDEQYGARGADVRKFSKQFTTSEQGITEYDEEMNELKALGRAKGKKRGKKLSITPSVAAIVEDLAAEDEETEAQVAEQKSDVIETATVSMATAAEQLLRNSLGSDDNNRFVETRVYTREIATEQTIGSYIRDNSAQTTQAEIYPIKDLIKIATSLKKAEADLKGKQDVVNASIRSTYNASVAKSAHSIYSRTNATLNRMEKYYKESVANIRRASRQECENLVAKLRDEYIVYYEEELKKRLSQTTKTIDYAGIGGDGQTQEQMAALMLENEQLRKQLEFNSTPQVPFTCPVQTLLYL